MVMLEVVTLKASLFLCLVLLSYFAASPYPVIFFDSTICLDHSVMQLTVSFNEHLYFCIGLSCWSFMTIYAKVSGFDSSGRFSWPVCLSSDGLHSCWTDSLLVVSDANTAEIGDIVFMPFAAMADTPDNLFMHLSFVDLIIVFYVSFLSDCISRYPRL